MEVDHDKQVVYTETLALALHEPELLLAAMQPTEEHVAGRLTSPIVSTHLDTRNIAFERWEGEHSAGRGSVGEGEGNAGATGCDLRHPHSARNKSGIWGWRSEKMEVVSGYEAKVSTELWGDTRDTLECGRSDGVPTQVYSASNVELVTKTRTEHLSDQDKSRSKGDSPVSQSGGLYTVGTCHPAWVTQVSGVGHCGWDMPGMGHSGCGV